MTDDFLILQFQVKSSLIRSGEMCLKLRPIKLRYGAIPRYVWRAGQERRLAMVHRYASLTGKRVLDAGCGLGMYTQAFQRYTPHVFGMEIEMDRAIEARERARGVTRAVGEALPFDDAAFRRRLLTRSAGARGGRPPVRAGDGPHHEARWPNRHLSSPTGSTFSRRTASTGAANTASATSHS